jgi:hypothetical protein
MMKDGLYEQVTLKLPGMARRTQKVKSPAVTLTPPLQGTVHGLARRLFLR